VEVEVAFRHSFAMALHINLVLKDLVHITFIHLILFLQIIINANLMAVKVAEAVEVEESLMC